ncbi:MAG: hypothetical protein HGGPFJEG_02588 [Ignavibacteria bacterium]|nr:hypothetical protein [Ignavibacteria bacterium]
MSLYVFIFPTCFVHVSPEFDVFTIIPPEPTAQTEVVSNDFIFQNICTSLFSAVKLVSLNQFIPPLVVFPMFPLLVTVYPVYLFLKLIVLGISLVISRNSIVKYCQLCPLFVVLYTLFGFATNNP